MMRCDTTRLKRIFLLLIMFKKCIRQFRHHPMTSSTRVIKSKATSEEWRNDAITDAEILPTCRLSVTTSVTTFVKTIRYTFVTHCRRLRWHFFYILVSLGAIQIILDTFLANFRPPSPCVIWWHVTCDVTIIILLKTYLLKTFVVKFC